MPEEPVPSDTPSQLPATASGRLIHLGNPDSGVYSAATTSTSATTTRRRRQRMPGLAILPTALTLGNAVCGVAALIELAKAFAAIGVNAVEAMTRISYAALLIGGGMLFDALDGKVARMTATTGRFGAELDSLCDAVTFGVTPAIMIRVAGEYFFARGGFDVDSKILWAVSGLYACCAILRLARFNVETPEDDDHTRFTGLPSPAAAACICSIFLGLIWVQSNVTGWESNAGRWVLRVAVPVLCAGVGLLMVSRVRYSHLFNRLVGKRQSLRTMVVFVLAVMAVWIFIQHWMLMVPILMLTYASSGPAYFAYRFLRGRGLLGRRMAVAERRRQREEQLLRKEKPAPKAAHAGTPADQR